MNLKELLKKALKEAGLNEELANHITITSEEQIEGIVSNLKPKERGIDFAKIIGSKEFSDFVSSKGYDEVLKLSKALQSGTDKKVTQGIKTHLSKLTPDGDEEPNPSELKNPNDPNVKFLELLSNLSEKVDGLSKERQRDSKLEDARKLIGKSQLPKKLQEKWLTSRIDLDKDIPEQIKELEGEYEETYGEAIKGTSKGLPIGGKVDTEVSDEEAEKIVNEM